jgi:hypothetical protein
MAIMSLHWIWHLVVGERYRAGRLQRRASPLMKIEVERVPDYRWRELGFSAVRRSDEADHAR